MESEIFGHVKGAFTGAVADRQGAARAADGGTLFLDEICEMAPDLQTKLLRFIQSGGFQKVGSTKPERVDIRIVCATNRDPLAEVRAGRFREDLYYRLHVVPIHMPPLREREADVLEIARHFLAAYATEEGKAFRSFAPEVERRLLAHDWPGNVRQLQNVIRNAVVLHDGAEVTADMLPRPFEAAASAPAAPGPALAIPSPSPFPSVSPPPALAPGPQAIRPLAEVERRAIEQAIAAFGGNMTKAAAALGVNPSTLYRKKQAWETGP